MKLQGVGKFSSFQFIITACPLFPKLYLPGRSDVFFFSFSLFQFPVDLFKNLKVVFVFPDQNSEFSVLGPDSIGEGSNSKWTTIVKSTYEVQM